MMTDWKDGYVTGIDYTFGYYHHLNPMRARPAFLERGLAFPKVENACELGFGQGLSMNIHAAASTTHWYGTDFNPAQAAFARELAAASGAGATIFGEDFETFTRRDDLPDFDFVGLHGVWSWVPEDNRRLIVDFLKRKLKEGGVLYIGYNTLPGWGDTVSMRHLMTRYMKTLDARPGDWHSRIKKTVDFAGKLLDTEPLVEKIFPRLKVFVEEIKKRDIHYIAHEYFNEEWCPMHFFDMEEILGGAHLRYVCSADFLLNTYLVDITREQRGLLQEIDDSVVRESVYDFMCNRAFRSDLWIKEGERRSGCDVELLEEQKFILVMPRDVIPKKVNYAHGTLDLNNAACHSVLDLMGDLQPRTLRQIESSIRNSEISSRDIQQVITLLVDIKCLDIVQEEGALDSIRARTSRLNAALRRHSQQGRNIEFLASPVTGGGVKVSRVSQLFLTSMEQGRTTPEEWAEYALRNFSQLGERLVKDGRTLGMEDEKRAELRERAEMFAQKSLPVLKAAGIA